MSTIHALPTDVVHLMAAGEVIDSLAAAVRELAENAIDAGATRISIALWADQWRVRVADNGSGLALADLQQAALSHSTSKIRDRQDLWNIGSLGFRGEALHSLAQLSQLEIYSRWVQAAEGWRVTYRHDGQPDQIEPGAIAPGTVVTVSDLFGNWLPRRQGLPSIAQQLRAVQLTIQQLALCHPQVTWQVEQGDRPWFSLWASPSAQQILPQIVRDVTAADLQEWTSAPNDAPGQLSILLGLPDRCHRHRPDWIKVAVNGRVVIMPALEQTILAAMRRTLPRDRHPVCFLHLQVPPAQLDWNRHPAKAEVYIQGLDQWQQRVTEAIAQALHFSAATLPDAAYSTRVGQLIRAAEPAGDYGSASAPTPLRALAQVHALYILAEHPTGTWLIEQHIAHERVLYEQLCDRWQLVPLEPSVILGSLSTAQQDQLQRIGIEAELFGENLWAARTAPAALAQRSDCAEALVELSQGGDLEAAIVATACRTAIRNGTPLTLQDMQTLIDQWQQTRNPRTCPHGRPIYLSLEESSLSRFFRRHWVVGKSHGI